MSVALLISAFSLGGCASCGKTSDTGDEGTTDAGGTGSTSSGNTGSSGASGSSSGVSSGGGSSGGTSGGSSGTTGSSGAVSSSSGDPAPTLLFTAPANDGSAVTAGILVNDSVTFTATITDNTAIQQAGIAWTLTPPTGPAGAPSGGTLTGNQASFLAVLSSVGTWTIQVSYSDGINPAVTAQLTAQVYSDLPPVLSWIAPANNGTAVTAARRVGTQLLFQASLADDNTLLQQNITWTHRHPDATNTTSQGNIIGTGLNQARLEFTADLATTGTHTLTVAYDDGANPRSLSLTVSVLADLPATVTFTAPSSAGGTVLVPVAVGDSLAFNVTLSDDTAIIPQNGTFTVVSPSGSTQNQGTITANGNGASATLTVPFTAAGTWRVEYTYTDAGGNVVTVVLTITVAQDPVPAVVIREPANDGTRVLAEVRENGQVTFRGNIQDNQPVQGQNVLWTYTPATGAALTSQGTIQGAGNSVNSTFAVASAGASGTATVSLRYTDGGGNTTTATLQVPVVSSATPSILITNPANDGIRANQDVRVNTQINFRATVTDDLDIVPSGLLWTLTSPGGAATTNPGGFAPGTPATTGTATFTASLVAAGDWAVAVRYTDGTGLSRTAQILVTALANNAPTCAWQNPLACMSAGQHTLRVTLHDADGDYPVAASIQSSNNADTVTTANVTYDGQGNATRTVNITLAAGTRTLTCTPTDSTGLGGTPAVLSITTVVAPTATLDAPLNNALISAGGNLLYDMSETHDLGAAPVTVTLTDSMAGPLSLDVNLAGTLTAPALGLHELVASVVDSCGGNATDSARYGVTVGGAALSTLGAPVTVGGATLDVRAALADGTGRLLLGTNSNNNAEMLYTLDTTGPSAAQFEPNTNGNGDDLLPVQGSITGISAGPTAGGNRWEAYATSGDGLFVCHVTGGGTTLCRQFQQGDGVGNGAQFRSDSVVDVAVTGTGAGTGEGFLVVAFQDRVQVFSLSFAGGQVTMNREIEIPRGDQNDSILGDMHVLRMVSFTSGPPVSFTFWVGTTDGAHLVTVTLTAGNNNRSIQHFDPDRPTPNNNVWPDFDVRDIALDPADAESAWFALAQGIGHYQGPGFGMANFSAISATSGFNPQNLTAIAVDRFPDAQKPILWLGTGGNGFARVDPAFDPALGVEFTTADGIGLPSNTIRSVVINPADTDHVKWIGTAQGMFGYRGH